MERNDMMIEVSRLRWLYEASRARRGRGRAGETTGVAVAVDFDLGLGRVHAGQDGWPRAHRSEWGVITNMSTS